MQDLNALVLHTAPPLDPAWLAHEEAANLRAPKPAMSILERQRLYATECRVRNSLMMATGARDHHLLHDISVQAITVSSSLDGCEIPILRYEPASAGVVGRTERQEEQVVMVYYHGGGLAVGEADSEELSCRRLIQSQVPEPYHLSKLFSVGYRLMPQVPASTCVSDAVDAFTCIRDSHPEAKFILVGSSSGGELAAFVSQMAPRGSAYGVLLRCPVTADAFAGPDYVPERLRHMYPSAPDSFVSTLLGRFVHQVPRDGLERMPLELPEDKWKGLPRTWIQICTNDVLYSDGLSYAKALQDNGVDVRVHVVEGFPHTFWLKAPHLDNALEADEEMVRALWWVVRELS